MKTSINIQNFTDRPGSSATKLAVLMHKQFARHKMDPNFEACRYAVMRLARGDFDEETVPEWSDESVKESRASGRVKLGAYARAAIDAIGKYDEEVQS